MNDRDTRQTGRTGSSNASQRLLSLAVLAFFAYLIWLAVTGQYDAQVDRVAGWLHRQYEQVRHMF